MTKPPSPSFGIAPAVLLAERELGSTDPAQGRGKSLFSAFSSIRMNLSSDEDLARLLLEGSADALAVLFRRHSRLVYGIVRKVLRNDAEAEDTLQTVFFDVFRSIHQFEASCGSFKTWLLLFAYHRAYNQRRLMHARRYEDTDAFQDLSPTQLGQVNLHSRYAISEFSFAMREALQKLKPQQQRAIQLIYFDGLSPEEVSEQTGETVRAVRHNLYRGIAALRALLSIPDRRPTESQRGTP